MSTSEMPRYILRNCTIFTDRVSKIGQASEISLPVPAEKPPTRRNAGPSSSGSKVSEAACSGPGARAVSRGVALRPM